MVQNKSIKNLDIINNNNIISKLDEHIYIFIQKKLLELIKKITIDYEIY